MHFDGFVGYGRVSTEEQAKNSDALLQQGYLLRELGAAPIFLEIISRMNEDRPGLEKALQFVESDDSKKGLLIKDLTRLTALPGLFETISKRLKACNKELKAVFDNVDIYSVSGETLAGIQVVVNRAEVLRTRERVLRGLDFRRQMGRANPIAPFGYVVEDNHYKFDRSPCPEAGGRPKFEVAREFVEIFFEARSLSGAVTEIISRFKIPRRQKPEAKPQIFEFAGDEEIVIPQNKKIIKPSFNWNAAGFGYWIRNPVLRGHTRYGLKKGQKRQPESERILLYNSHNDRLLTEEQYEEVCRIIDYNRNNQKWGNNNNPERRHPLSGLLVCKDCGWKMKITAINRASDYCYYKCSKSLKKQCKNTTCVSAREIEKLLIAELIKKAEEIANKGSEENSERPPELIQLDEQLRGLRAIAPNPAIKQAIQDIERQIEAKEYDLSQQGERCSKARETILAAAKSPNYWESLSKPEKLEVWHWLIETIEVRAYRTKARKSTHRITKINWRF
ncbi:MAG: recombinase family protein [Cyanobacteria bacterium SBLK]|nr:recombinase family protein [Cyanobacteria bacterium SBLK]